ncbi:putative disease resistance RPP13-like protein 1 [Carex rostrata]
MLQRIQYDEKTCVFVMHDLVQNLAEFVAGDAFRRLDTEIFDSIPSRARYLSVLVNSLPNVVDFTSIRPSTSLRALQIFNTINLWLGKDICIKLNEEIFHNLRSLRILNFSNTGIKTLPDSIGNLKQLHFLGLARTKIEVLPESICFLYNLQTLDLLGCPLQELPKGTKNLVNLQHLIVEIWSNIHLPHGIGYLTNLETLPVFNIGRGSGCEISELSKLNKLCGELRITGLDYIQQHDEQGAPVDLIKKKNICTLILDWRSHKVSKNGSYSTKEVPVGNHEVVLAVLQPQLNIKMLKLYHYPGLSFPRWLGDPSYSRLVEVVLFGNSEKGSKFLPTLGLLPSLKTLSIQCMLTVEYAGYEFRGHDTGFKAFLSLDKLEFKYMPKWVQWFGVECHDFSSLNTLKLVHCTALRFMPEYLSFSLRKLVLSSCKEIIYLPTMLPSLANLILMGDINKLLLSNLGLPSLRFLEIGFSENIKSIELDNNKLQSLETLVIKCCKNVSYFSGVAGLFALRELQLDGCLSLYLCAEPIPPSLQVLKVTNCPGLWLWERVQWTTFGHQLQRRGTDRDNYLEAFPDEDISQGKDYNNAYEEAILANDYGETLDFNYEMNFQVPSSAVPISWDDYNSDWLLSVSQNSRKYNDNDQLPSCSRKRFRNGSKKEVNTVSGKQKGLLLREDSSASSIGDASDNSELGSFGSTSEENFCL